MSSRAIQILIESFPKIIVPGIIYTIPLTLISFAIGLILAIIVALLRIRSNKIIQGVCWFYVWVFRGTPQLVQLFIIFYGLPSIGVRWNALLCAVIAFSLNVGAYASETIRGAILSVPNGQKEAAYACGMTCYSTAGAEGEHTCAFQHIYIACQGYIPGIEHNCNGNVHGNDPSCSCNI